MSNTGSITLLCVAIIAGALVPFQAGANAVLGRLIGYPLWATLASLVFSVIMVLLILLLIRAPSPAFAAALKGPWWIWVGGAAGVVYLTAALIITPKIGVANFMVAVIAGQMVTSMIIDHFGLMGLPQKPVSTARIVGLLMVVGGMVVIQMDGAGSNLKSGP